MAPGCNPHQNLPNVEHSEGGALCYINLGGGYWASKSYLLDQASDNNVRSIYLRDYSNRIDGSFKDDLNKLMESSYSVVDYIGANDNEPIECDSEVIEH